MNIIRFFSSLFPRRKIFPGHYNIKVVSLPDELTYYPVLPKELIYVIEKIPSIKIRISKLLERYGLGLRTIEKTPELVLEAVNEISVLTQHRTIITWLIPLLKKGIRPKFSAEDYENARNKNIDLERLVDIIFTRRFDFKQFILIDESCNLNPQDNIQLERFIEIEKKSSLKIDTNNNIRERDLALVAELNKHIEDISLEYAVNRIIFDNADTRTAVAQSIIKALLIIGPITHFLEKFARGIGKVFAASTDDILSETAELFALRGSGFTWKVVLFQRLKILLPVFILATYGAFNVEWFIEREMYPLAGFLFGFSAVALSLTTAIQSIKIYKKCIDDLINEKKIPDTEKRWRLAIKQDFTNPARLGLFAGAITSPIISIIIFDFFPYLVHNGWVLALLGSIETIVAGITVLLSRGINDLRYRLFLSKLLDNLNK
ncbi:MAG TPA: hypothetical protein PKW14_07705 [Bacteroidota bacterium]|nr:hypothetical protein [Bacteroidota bacterium]